VKPSWIRTAYYRGEAVALVGHLPDMNEATPRDGELFPFGWAGLLGGIHLRSVPRSRLAMIGIARRFRGTRVGSLAISLLMAEAIETARGAGIGEVEISWMLEHNQAILNLVASLPARHTRTFRIFTRPL
jgi:GNAT superfamily N-acetyltransferase